MKQSQLVVNLPPDEVMRRLAASIDQPNVSLMNPFAGKDFYGQLNGYQFWLRPPALVAKQFRSSLQR